jgi:cytochrome oxidase Cu insertion factor (SCO1/SenC/PrrC family)
LQTAEGGTTDFTRLHGRWVLVDFIYTRCMTYCSVQGSEFARMQDRLARPIAAGKVVLVTAHGNSLRALVKHLDGISDEDIAELNIPTGIPLVYELGDDFMPLGPGRYLDPEAAAAGAAAVAAQGKK